MGLISHMKFSEVTISIDYLNAEAQGWQGNDFMGIFDFSCKLYTNRRTMLKVESYFALEKVTL